MVKVSSSSGQVCEVHQPLEANTSWAFQAPKLRCWRRSFCSHGWGWSTNRHEHGDMVIWLGIYYTKYLVYMVIYPYYGYLWLFWSPYTIFCIINIHIYYTPPNMVIKIAINHWVDGPWWVWWQATWKRWCGRLQKPCSLGWSSKWKRFSGAVKR